MNLNDFLELSPDEINRMTRKELAKALYVATSAANKRVALLEKSGLNSPALDNVERSGGKFSVAGKSLNQLRSEYSRVSSFLNAKTSTVRGARRVWGEMETRLGFKITAQQANNLWTVYNRLNELEPALVRQMGSDRIQKYISSMVDRGERSIDEMTSDALAWIGRQYEEIEADDYDPILDIWGD